MSLVLHCDVIKTLSVQTWFVSFFVSVQVLYVCNISGALSNDHDGLLPRRDGHHAGLRHHQRQVLRQHRQVAEKHSGARQRGNSRENRNFNLVTIITIGHRGKIALGQRGSVPDSNPTTGIHKNSNASTLQLCQLFHQNVALTSTRR